MRNERTTLAALVAARPLRIGLNLLYLVPGAGGLGRYARELIRAMREWTRASS